LLRSDDQVAALNQPKVKFVGGVDAICLAQIADLLVLGGALRLAVQEDLDRAGEALAVLAPLVVYVALDCHGILLRG
jgi:hypothetical protein